MMRHAMIPVEEAQRRVMAEVVVGDAESVTLPDAHGRVLREEVVAAEDSPAADNSGMDGYAVRAADLPGTLRVIGEIAAGT
jgi:molybdopterin molybdotransferase